MHAYNVRGGNVCRRRRLPREGSSVWRDVTDRYGGTIRRRPRTPRRQWRTTPGGRTGRCAVSQPRYWDWDGRLMYDGTGAAPDKLPHAIQPRNVRRPPSRCSARSMLTGSDRIGKRAPTGGGDDYCMEPVRGKGVRFMDVTAREEGEGWRFTEAAIVSSCVTNNNFRQVPLAYRRWPDGRRRYGGWRRRRYRRSHDVGPEAEGERGVKREKSNLNEVAKRWMATMACLLGAWCAGSLIERSVSTSAAGFCYHD